MNRQVLRYPSATGVGDIYAEVFLPAGTPCCILQITHDMAEHSGRYQAFIEFLLTYGVIVASLDLAGHGKSFEELNHIGYFGHINGRTALVQDMKELRDQVAEEYPELPYILFGHGFGALLAQIYASFHTADLDACIFSAPLKKPSALRAYKILARLAFIKNGPRKPSVFLHKLYFGAYLRRIKVKRTQYDWLSRDSAAVSAYANDPMCGFYFTAEGMRDFFRVISEANARAWAKKMGEIPVLLFAGDQDPASGYGKHIRRLAQRLQKSKRTTTLVLYPGGRHDMLMEINKSEVYREVYAFLWKYFKN